MIDGRIVKAWKQAGPNFLPECVLRAQGLISIFQ